MIYVFLADRFEEIEAIAPIDILRRAGFDVKTVGVTGEFVTGAHGVTVKADITTEQLRKENVEMVVLPGGPGHKALDESSVVNEMLDFAVGNHIFIGAICAAPSILGKKGLLNGVRATCFPGYEQYLVGAKLGEEPVYADKQFITAKGAGVSVEFGLALVQALAGAEKANQLGASLQCRSLT